MFASMSFLRDWYTDFLTGLYSNTEVTRMITENNPNYHCLEDLFSQADFIAQHEFLLLVYSS